MPKRRYVIAGLAALTAEAGGGAYALRTPSGKAEAAALYAQPLSAPAGPMEVYHLGHSLVGHDMPAMLAQLAGHNYHSQLGWGASLRQHWEPDVAVNGFDEMNAHPRFAPAANVLDAGGADAVILTEMVEIKDAIRYHDSPDYLARWAGRARAGNGDARIYLYETWHHTNDPAGWLVRIDSDLQDQWLDRLLYPALGQGAQIHLIPAGQVMAAVTREAEAKGLMTRDDLMSKQADGTPDTIHLSDLGAYLVALTHYAALYHRSPVGLPAALTRADGTPVDAPDAELAALMQRVVWDVVRQHPQTGVAG